MADLPGGASGILRRDYKGRRADQLVTRIDTGVVSLVAELRGHQRASAKRIENHAAAVALGDFAYNFIKIHRTLRMTPAMAAGVTNRLWEVADLVAAWEACGRRKERAA